MKSSPAPSLIIVNGHPATGKTTFASDLSTLTGIPLFTKDGVKELLHSTFGAADREESRKLGMASYTLLEHSADTMLAAGQSLIIESNFDAAGSGTWISRLEDSYAPNMVQVFLHASPDAILRRFAQRSERRHPAHFDDVAADELRRRLEHPYGPLQVRGRTLCFETSDFSSFDSNAALRRVASLLADEPGA